MKKSILVALCIVATPTFASEYGEYGYEYNNHTARDTYVGFRVHKNENIAFANEMSDGFTTTAKDDSFGIGLVVGNKLTDNVKIEFETSYNGGGEQKHGTDYDFDIWSNMLNVYLFQEFGGAVEPYVGIGVGLSGLWAGAHGNGIDASDSTADMSWSAMIGVNFALNARIDLNVGLKYQNYGDTEMTSHGGRDISTEIDGTEFYIGAVYKFGL